MEIFRKPPLGVEIFLAAVNLSLPKCCLRTCQDVVRGARDSRGRRRRVCKVIGARAAAVYSADPIISSGSSIVNQYFDFLAGTAYNCEIEICA